MPPYSGVGAQDDNALWVKGEAEFKIERGNLYLGSRHTVNICKTDDCELQPNHTVIFLKRDTTLEFTNITPILYIHY